jgi:tetratricopeptide (TPR) repeat protein
MHRFLLLISSLSIATGCLPRKDFSPKLSYEIEHSNIAELPGPFPPLSEKDKQHDWGREYMLGLAFAHELNLYQALTCFKRAQFLLPHHDSERHTQLSYEVVLCYYLAKKYREALDTFENGPLVNVNGSFPAYQDLVIILADCFEKTDQHEKADHMLQRLHQTNPEAAEHMHISEAMQTADWKQLDTLAKEPTPTAHNLKHFLRDYHHAKKSVSNAALLNAFLPGAGYWYIGQRDTAVTALLFNSLFIVAAYEFFHHGFTAAGIITTSFELGWYFGGIYGGAEAAKFYNQRIYETAATPYMEQQHLFPVLLFRFGF